MLSEIEAISPLVDRLMPLIRESQCVPGEEQDVELALREALGNAVVRGNQQDARRKVHDPLPVQVAPSAVHLGEGRRKRIQLEAQGISAGSTDSEHGRGILLMNAYMDGVRYSRGGSEVRMCKRVRSIQ